MGMTVTTFASEPQINTYTTTDGIVADKSIQESVIDSLPESMKLELQNDESTLVSVSTTYYDLDTGSKTRAVMPTSDFKLTVTASRLSAAQMKKDGVSGDAFKFVATGEWLVNPTFEFTDCMGISWSDSFTLYSHTGYTYSKNANLIDYTAVTLNSVSPEQGFACDVDLLLFSRQDEVTITGKVYKAQSSGSANVCASYGHVIVTPSSVNVTYSSSKQLSMSVSWTSGIQMASPDYKSFNY